MLASEGVEEESAILARVFTVNLISPMKTCATLLCLASEHSVPLKVVCVACEGIRPLGIHSTRNSD